MNHQLVQQYSSSYLDVDFDISSISELSHKERAAFKPIYSMNKWWARRSSSVFRAILLGLILPPDANFMEEFYKNHTTDYRLKDKIVMDPFMGGGTTIVEALRLGYKAIGIDINPFSWFIVKTETSQVNLQALEEAFKRVEREVASTIKSMYVTTCPCCGSEADVIYAFWVKVASCLYEGCDCNVPLFRDYIVGTRRGEVPVRYFEITCPFCEKVFDWELDRVDLVYEHLTPFRGESSRGDRPWSYGKNIGLVQCPCCDQTVHLALKSTKPLTKKVPVFALLCPKCESVFSHRGLVPDDVQCPNCNHHYNPHKGTTDDGEFVCPQGHKNTIMDAVAVNPDGQPLSFRLYAIEGFCPHCADKRVREQEEQISLWCSLPPVHPEARQLEVCPNCQPMNHKFFKKPSKQDLQRYTTAVQRWEACKADLPWPKEPIYDYEKTNRLIIHNYRYWYQLFNPRQLLALTYILKAILAETDQAVKEALVSAFLGTLEHQNMLNIYHILYAQSAGAFGRHDFHPKVMACEGNPWGSERGRGPFILTYASVVEGKKYLQAPYDASYANGERVNIFTGEVFSGKSATEFAELVENDKNLLLSLQDSSRLDSIPDNSVDYIVTDPPYADAVQYAELSDFFYAWLREALRPDYPELFREQETPKDSEIVENKRRNKNQQSFYRGLAAVFNECNRVLKPDGRLVFTFHHSKKSQWISLLETLLQTGFVLINVYPVKSEATGSGNLVFYSNSNSVAYDIIHVCQKAKDLRDHTRRHTDWKDLRESIRAKVMRHVEGIRTGKSYGQRIAHADVRVMLWGECLAAYSQNYGSVFRSDGKPMDVAQAFEAVTNLVNEIFEGRQVQEMLQT